jgi:hypothetical protein
VILATSRLPENNKTLRQSSAGTINVIAVPYAVREGHIGAVLAVYERVRLDASNLNIRIYHTPDPRFRQITTRQDYDVSG